MSISASPTACPGLSISRPPPGRAVRRPDHPEAPPAMRLLNQMVADNCQGLSSRHAAALVLLHSWLLGPMAWGRSPARPPTAAAVEAPARRGSRRSPATFIRPLCRGRRRGWPGGANSCCSSRTAGLDLVSLLASTGRAGRRRIFADPPAARRTQLVRHRAAPRASGCGRAQMANSWPGPTGGRLARRPGCRTRSARPCSPSLEPLPLAGFEELAPADA
jgi:hypothetical protein